MYICIYVYAYAHICICIYASIHWQWQSSGEAGTLLCEIEEALSILYARLILLDLLRKAHAPSAQLIGATELLQLLAPLFPSHALTSHRELFSSGPHRSMRVLLDEALHGWRAAQRGDALMGRLLELSKKCEHTLRHNAVCAVRACSSVCVCVCVSLCVSLYIAFWFYFFFGVLCCGFSYSFGDRNVVCLYACLYACLCV
jgi:hypothetical protein